MQPHGTSTPPTFRQKLAISEENRIIIESTTVRCLARRALTWWSDVLYHSSIRDKSVVLREMHRVLRTGGLVFLNLPAYQWLFSSHDKAYQQDRRFTRAAVLKLLRANGFEPVTATYWNTFLFPAAAVARVWRNFSNLEGSDLKTGSAQFASRLFGAMLSGERALIRRFPLPFDLSVFAVGRKV